MQQPVPDQSEADARRRRLGVRLILGLAALAGLWLLVVVGREGLAYRAAAGWPAVAGEVISATVEALPGAADGADGYGVVVRYRYTVDGRTYESDRLRRAGAERLTTRAAADEVLASYLAGGRAVTVRYDPADPATAVLRITPPIYLFLFVAVYWGILGLFVYRMTRRE
jgi:hypothetical protein